VVEVCGLNLRFGLLYSGITFVLFWFSADYISAIFSENPQVIALCSLYLILNSLGHSGIYLSNWMSQMFNVIGRPRSVLLLNFCRVFLYIVPLVFLGSKYYGFKGLIIGLIIGNILSGVHSQILSRLLIKEIQAE
jgi:Na+-driven multidrug efflux pump